MPFIKNKFRPRRIGIIGSRRRDSEADYRKFVKVFDKIYKPGDVLVSGGCPKGGDRFAERIAKERGLSITIHFPDWSLGKFAGLTRNTTIAKDSDILIAVVANDRTGGTEDTIKKIDKLGKEVVLVK